MISEPFYSRLNRLRDFLKTHGATSCLVENPIDLFYLTGQHFSCGTLLIKETGEELFVDGRYFEQARMGTFPTTATSDEALKKAFADQNHLAFDSYFSSYERFTKLSSLTATPLIPIPSLLKHVRAIKEPHELQLMKHSAALLWRGFEHICTLIKAGISEKQLAWAFEIFCKNQGAEKLAFDPIIAFGAHTAMPHHHCTDSLLKPGDPILIDIGVCLHGYRSDMTRMVFFPPVHEEVFRLYEIVQRAQKAALAQCRPGACAQDLDLAARAIMHAEGVEDLFVHSLGHGIGLETHEFPRITSKGEDKHVLLKEGMVITVEPGLYIPGIGGVRYEDTVHVTHEGFENFYGST